jgi:hypothetical protein
MLLVRQVLSPDGIFGELFTDDGSHVAVTLEHSYGLQPKLPDGEYQCVRGFHQLQGMHHTFETFEITGVPGHSGILFHTGNFNKDSSGCVLLGLSSGMNPPMIYSSREAFAGFMKRQVGLSQFTLTVTTQETP